MASYPMAMVMPTKIGIKGQGFFGNSNCRGGKADDCHEKGNDEDPHPAADHAQELGNQPVKSTGANDEANEAVGNEEKENDRRRVLHAKVNTLEHFKKPTGWALTR